MARFQNVLLVINPVSGLARGDRAGEGLKKKLQELGIAITTRRTAGPGDAARWAQTAGEEGFDLIVAVGGDGTLQEVAAGMMSAGRKIPIGHVPVGTANVVALALSLPWSTKQALDVLLTGKIVPFDVGYLPELGRHFILMAAIGYPARVILDSPRTRKKVFGFLAYVAAGVRNLFVVRRARLVIATDGVTETIEADTVMVANIGRLEELKLRLTPESSPHDGKFDVVVISSRTFLELVKILWRMLTGRDRPTRRLLRFQARRLRIASEPPMPVQIDGELLGTTPLVAEVVASGIEMVVPQRYAAR